MGEKDGRETEHMFMHVLEEGDVSAKFDWSFKSSLWRGKERGRAGGRVR